MDFISEWHAAGSLRQWATIFLGGGIWDSISWGGGKAESEMSVCVFVCVWFCTFWCWCPTLRTAHGQFLMTSKESMCVVWRFWCWCCSLTLRTCVYRRIANDQSLIATPRRHHPLSLLPMLDAHFAVWYGTLCRDKGVQRARVPLALHP